MKNLTPIGSISGIEVDSQVTYPYVDNTLLPNLSKLGVAYPGLVITSAYRDKDLHSKQTGANPNSPHLVGKSLDLRLNSVADKLATLSKAELAKYGIESIGIHNNNHYHVDFL